MCPARVTTDLSLSLSRFVAQDLNYVQGSLSLYVTFILFDLDGLVSFPDFIAIYLLTLEKKFTPFSPNQWERERERELRRWLSWRSWNQISALSPPRLAADTPLSKTAPSTPSWRSQLLFTLHTFIYVFICVCTCMCVQLCMYVWVGENAVCLIGSDLSVVLCIWNWVLRKWLWNCFKRMVDWIHWEANLEYWFEQRHRVISIYAFIYVFLSFFFW